MRNEHHNDVQELIHSISGYSAYEEITSAQDDGYYECNKNEDKLNYIKQFCDSRDDIGCMSKDDIESVFNFLEEEFDNASKRDAAFDSLSS